MGLLSAAGTSFVDRLAFRYTAGIFVILSLVLAVKQYGGRGMHCWCPAQFTPSHVEYANSVCWANNLIHLPYEDELPSPSVNLTQPEPIIAYYQWTPILLLCGAALFIAPHIMWLLQNHLCGGSVVDIGKRGQRYIRESDTQERKKMMGCLASEINEVFRRRSTNILLRIIWFIRSLWLSLTYLSMKVYYGLISAGLFVLLDMFLSQSFVPGLYGIQVLSRVVLMAPWSTSGQFPMVTLCNFEIKHLSRVHDYTVQCTVSANLFNEVIAIFVWFWLLIVGGAAVFSLLRWIFILLWRPCYVGTRLAAQIKYHDQSLSSGEARHQAWAFTSDGLTLDTYLAIRLVAHNAGDAAASELMFALWKDHQADKCQETTQPGDSRTNPRPTPDIGREPKQISSPQLQYTTAKDGGSTAARRRAGVEAKESNIEQLWVARNSEDDIANAPSLTEMYPTLNMNLNM